MTKHTKAVALAGVVVVAVLSAAACEDTMTPAGVGSTKLSAGLGLPSIPAARMDLPPTPRPWDNDVEALRSELEKSEGLAIVAIKDAASPRAFEAGGLRASVSRDGFERGVDALIRAGAAVEHIYALLGMALVRLPAEAVAAVHQSPWVDFVEPELPIRAASESLPRAVGGSPGVRATSGSSQSLLTQTTPWGVSMVTAPQAWAYTTGSTQKAMIISRWGMTLGHSDLPPIPPSNCGGYFAPCDGPNGWAGNQGAGVFFALNDANGTVGVAPGVAGTDAYSWRACTEPAEYPPNGFCYVNMVITGVEQAITHGIKTVLIHDIYFAESNPALASALATAWENGVITVAGVGTSGPGARYIYPASYSQTVGVSGVLQDRSFATYPNPQNPCTIGSGYGTYKVDVSAPYSGYTTDLPGRWLDPACGTRIAAAHVAGVLALIRARFPTMTAADAYNRLISSASYAGDAEHFGSGIVNALAAMYEPPPPITLSIDGQDYVRAYSTCTWYASAAGGTPPFTYSWTAQGQPAGDGTFALTYTAGATGFALTVVATDSRGVSAGPAIKIVDIDPHVLDCLQ